MRPDPAVRFDDAGLIPVVVQDDASQRVLMLAFMNEEALRLTQETGRAHYWSRSRNKLWRKGETSGNEQIVTDLRVNCERNSLLLSVIQQGAVCHDGYATCYYRRVNADGSLQIVEERQFNPAEVYGSSQPSGTSLSELTRAQMAAYQYLRDHDLGAQSGTSRLLRNTDKSVAPRVADELLELAGVLAGEHHHDDPLADTQLEASQVIYWLLVEALRLGFGWEQVRPDLSLAMPDAPPRDTTIALLRAAAQQWQSLTAGTLAQVQSTLSLVAVACHVAGADPLEVVSADLAALRSRPYLAAHFAVET
ncbi:MAG: phosphoribosyl-AMP cyclohydrolase [Thermomicrobiales bacterium]|nr:phosphoribosyl-AMP cyclohydrolase [Thermomicrobiales bacterium]